MKTIREPNERVAAIIGKKKPDPAAKYVLSIYSVLCPEVSLMMNTFSGEVISLSGEELSAVSSLEGAEHSFGDIERMGFTELIKKRFIVEAGFDEAAKYEDTVRLMKIMSPEPPGLSSYTILPTTGCNARCTYCYEEGMAVRTMDKRTADRLIDFLCETKQAGKIKISWFGGEPLMCSGTISYICRGLRERGAEYSSKVVTNLSLMTRDLARELRELWNTSLVQVSLDGTKRHYTERKLYLDPKRYNYEQVMEAVHFLLDEGIKVQLRVNFDRENLEDMQEFINEMEEEFRGSEGLRMYLSMLFQQQRAADCIEVYGKLFELYDRNRDSFLLKNMGSIPSIKLAHCMADSLDKTIVIDPEGNFYDCEHLPGNDNTWGNIFDGVTDSEKLKALKAPAQIDPQCRGCPFLPQCTPFFRRHCPDYFERCREYNSLLAQFQLRSLARDIEE